MKHAYILPEVKNWYDSNVYSYYMKLEFKKK